MNIYCFSTLSFAKLQFKSVINKAFHKHGVASFTDAWIETLSAYEDEKMKKSHLLQMRGLNHTFDKIKEAAEYKSHLLQMRGLKPSPGGIAKKLLVASFTDAWIETPVQTAPPAMSSRIFYRCVD